MQMINSNILRRRRTSLLLHNLPGSYINPPSPPRFLPANAQTQWKVCFLSSSESPPLGPFRMSFGSTHEHLIVRRGKVFEASENIFRGMSVMQVCKQNWNEWSGTKVLWQQVTPLGLDRPCHRVHVVKETNHGKESRDRRVTRRRWGNWLYVCRYIIISRFPENPKSISYTKRRYYLYSLIHR